MRGYTFNRQKPLDRYIVDFYCKPLDLVIEIDGGYHFETEQVIKDKERQAILQLKGLNFLRFTEQEVMGNIEFVLQAIEEFIIGWEERRVK